MSDKKLEIELSPGRIFNSFTNNIENLMEFVASIAPIATAFDEKALGKLESLKSGIEDILSQPCPYFSPKDGNSATTTQSKIIVNPETVNKIIEVVQKYRRLPWLKTERTELLYKSALVMLASCFDYLITDIIRCYHKRFQDSFSDKNLTINLLELKSCADRDEAIDLLLNKKLDNIMYGSLDSQKAYLVNDIKIDLMEKAINWDFINEVIERRNIIVHNDGIVNRRYLKNVKIAEVGENPDLLKEGMKLCVSNRYFKIVSKEILFAGIVLLQICWRKWVKEDLSEADTALMNIMYELTLKKEYDVLERVGLFSRQVNPYDTESRYIFDFIYYLSLKCQGKNQELESYLAKIDKSVLRPKLLVALSALYGDRDGFYNNLKKAAAIGDLTKSDFADSSLVFLLNEFQQDEDYEKKFNEIFPIKHQEPLPTPSA
jgi:hypothetical protein